MKLKLTLGLPEGDTDVLTGPQAEYAVTAGGFQNSGDPNADDFTASAQDFFSGGAVGVHDYAAT